MTGPGEPAVSLPPAVRDRVATMAASALASLAEADVPASLRRIRTFTPTKRGRLGAAPLLTALAQDSAFRLSIAAVVRGQLPELAAALDAGEIFTAVPAVPAVPAVSAQEVAAAAYLLRSEGWTDLVARVGQTIAEQAGARRQDLAADAADRLTEQLAAVRAELRAVRRRGEIDLAAARGELAAARGRARAAGDADRRSAAAAQARADDLAERLRVLTTELALAEQHGGRLRGELVDARAAADAARRGGRAVRDLNAARLQVLLETLSGAARGVARELGLSPVGYRPADTVVATMTDGLAGEQATGFGGLGVAGLAGSDPALVDRLLAVPGVHLVVDGYNVTKSGYPTLTLEAQRTRLVAGLAELAARTGAEVTCVFDGTNRPPGLALGTLSRGIRVVFSPAGVLADDVIVSLVTAEPAGRPIFVVTSDRAVATAVERAGARVADAVALLARLNRA